MIKNLIVQKFIVMAHRKDLDALNATQITSALCKRTVSKKIKNNF